MANDLVRNKKKIKVIYCMGSGRSGSTLLGIILGLNDYVVSPGEISNLPRLPQDNFACSCGDRVVNCSFWSKVLSKWKTKSGDDNVTKTIDRIGKIENFKSPLAWLRVLINYPGKSKYFNYYFEHTYNFLDSIIDQSEKTIIVDISKNPLRALIMTKHPRIDLKLIHLVRDGRGIAWSLFKFTKIENKRKAVWRSALFWLIVNKQSNYVRKKAPNSGLIKYEDLVTAPEKTLRKIGEICDINPESMIENIYSDLALKNSHIMAGNALRKQKSIKLNLNTEWKEKLDLNKQKTFTRIAGGIMADYGYLKNEVN